jgi:phosphomannomutase
MIKFGPEGWRARISEEFTFANVKSVSEAAAQYLVEHKYNEKPLIVGYDPRFLADRFAETIVLTMENAGIDCLLCERDTPTPAVEWEVKDRGACGAVMVTAGDDPPQNCGIRFIAINAAEIEKYLGRPSNLKANKKGKAERIDPRERYFQYLLGMVDQEKIRSAKLKIVVDPLYGSARGYLDKLLQRLGCEVEELHNFRDVLFGGMDPDLKESNLKELKAKVIGLKADLGIALNCDGSHCVLVDKKGALSPSNGNDGIRDGLLAADRLAKLG